MIPKERFVSEILSIALKVPTLECQSILKNYQEFLMKTPRRERITATDDPDFKLILFDVAKGVPPSLSHYEQSSFPIKLTYEDASMETVLKELIPPDVTIPSGFESIGHIAHFNLTPEQMPYRNIIGSVVVDVSTK